MKKGNVHDLSLMTSKNAQIKDWYEKAMSELNDFWEIKWVDSRPEVYLVSGRNALDIVLGEKTEDWVVGRAVGNKIFLLSLDVYEKESRHSYSDGEYYSLLKHELCHLYMNIFSKGHGPVWMEEGIPIYVSGELERKERPEKYKSFLSYYDCFDEGVYDEAGFVISDLIDRYGKEKLLEFVKLLSSVKNEGDFVSLFEEFWGFELEYKSFI